MKEKLQARLQQLISAQIETTQRLQMINGAVGEIRGLLAELDKQEEKESNDEKPTES